MLLLTRARRLDACLLPPFSAQEDHCAQQSWPSWPERRQLPGRQASQTAHSSLRPSRRKSQTSVNCARSVSASLPCCTAVKPKPRSTLPSGSTPQCWTKAAISSAPISSMPKPGCPVLSVLNLEITKALAGRAGTWPRPTTWPLPRAKPKASAWRTSHHRMHRTTAGLGPRYNKTPGAT